MMRRSGLSLALALSTSSLLGALALVACSSSSEGGPGSSGGIDGSTNPDGSSSGGDGSADPDGSSSGDGGNPDGGPGDSGADGPTNPDAGPPAVQFIGRFDTSEAAGPRMAWPGTKVVARFNGTDATVKLSQTFDGYQAGPSWFNVIVDGTLGAPFSVAAADEDHVVAQGLPLGNHTIEIEKRTEANHGTVRFQGFTFTGGTGLLPPPARPTKRMEWIAESTIDGFGVEGDRSVTCIGTAPAQYDNVRKSLAFYTTTSFNAEMHVTAYSGKGVADTESGLGIDALTMPLMWTRALPDPGAGSPFDTTTWTPDVVVISLGGVDYRNGVAGVAADFATKYGAFVDDIRAKYGANTYIWLTVWSQIKNAERADLGARIDTVLAARAGDTKLKKYVFPEANVNTDETGCYFHANDAHHQAMAALMKAQIQGVVPGY